MGFDFDSATRQKLGYKLIDCINDYFSSLPDRPVQMPVELREFQLLEDPMPETAADAARVLEDACRQLIDKGFHAPSGNYLGLMNPTPTFISVLAEALVAALNPQLGSFARSQFASLVEHQTVQWVGGRIGWKAPFNGTFTTGGNEANFSALALALNAKFPGVVMDGVASVGAPPVLYSSAESHHSLEKSAGLLGLGRRALRRIPVTARMQMDLEQLETAITADLAAGNAPFAVVATGGTTNSGAIDDINAIADICQRYGLWLHVDAAYGGAVLFSDHHRALLNGVERADSITVDPHKWLAMPFAAGIILTSRPEMLTETFAVTSPYMPKFSGATLVDNFKISAQWSRRMNSLKFWLTLRVHGRKAYEELIARQLELARGFAAWIEASEDYELAAPQTLPIVNFRVRAKGRSEEEVAEANRAVVHAVTDDGRRWISTTHVAGHHIIRMMVISYLTEERHVRGLEEALAQAAVVIQPRSAVR